jgi:hypothetical protein
MSDQSEDDLSDDPNLSANHGAQISTGDKANKRRYLPKNVYVMDKKNRCARFRRKRKVIFNKFEEICSETGCFGYVFLRSYRFKPILY